MPREALKISDLDLVDVIKQLLANITKVKQVNHPSSAYAEYENTLAWACLL